MGYEPEFGCDPYVEYHKKHALDGLDADERRKVRAFIEKLIGSREGKKAKTSKLGGKEMPAVAPRKKAIKGKTWKVPIKKKKVKPVSWR